jgi:hypothetical protein
MQMRDIAGCKVPLAMHQKAMLRRCLDIERQHIGTDQAYGVLSDAPGTGKTYVVLAMILALKQAGNIGTNLIAVPSHVYAQWRAEIKAFSDNITLKEFHGYSDVGPWVSGARRADDVPDVLLTTHLLLKTFLEQARGDIHRIVLDEPDSAASWSACIRQQRPAFPCKMVWYMSASIGRLLGTVPPNHECRCDPKFVQQSFGALFDNRKGIYTSADHRANLPSMAVRCRNILVSKVLNGMFKGTPRQLAFNACDYGAGMRTADQLLRAMRDRIAEGVAARQLDLEAVAKRKRFVSKPEIETLTQDLHKQRSMGEALRRQAFEAGVCWICMLPIVGTHAFKPHCSATSDKIKPQLLCEACTESSATCPCCFKEDCGMGVVSDLPVHTHRDFKTCDKLDVLISGLSGKDKAIAFGKKVLLCHQHYTVNFEQALERARIEFTDDVQRFAEEDDVRVLVMNPALLGCGINLPMTTDVVFAHKVDPNTERQVVGRAQRPGRRTPEPVHVFYLQYDTE